MSGGTSVDERYLKNKTDRAHQRLDEYEEVHEQFDRRISRNENWRLQAQGALKILAVIVGAGGLAVVVDLATGLF